MTHVYHEDDENDYDTDDKNNSMYKEGVRKTIISKAHVGSIR